MDVTTKAIVLKATDYKENDKFVLLYSLEYGKISVHAKGIRKGKAKLKFCADQFCFGQYELSLMNDRFTLQTCDQLESFFNLREDIVVFYSACVVAECLANYTEEGQSEPSVFIETLRALETLSANVEPLAVTLRFLLAFFELQGIKLKLDECVSCGANSKRLYLDAQRGGLVCENCRSADCVAISQRAIAVSKMYEHLQYEKLGNINVSLDILKDALNLCDKYIARTYYPLKSLSELIKLA